MTNTPQMISLMREFSNESMRLEIPTIGALSYLIGRLLTQFTPEEMDYLFKVAIEELPLLRHSIDLREETK